MTARRVAGFSMSCVLHAATIVVAFYAVSAPGPKPGEVAARAKPIAIAVVPADSLSLPGLQPVDARNEDQIIAANVGSSDIALPGFTFNVRRVRDRATLLFPFLTPGLALERFGLQPRTRPVSGVLSWSAAAQAAQRATPGVPPLTLSADALQSLVDRAWSRRDRWEVFQDPDAG